MWGEVTPAERLRSVTRRHLDDDRLAADAADALAGFADEPASLVVACRRVLAHHLSHGALWWVCARILAAAEPARAAREAAQQLEGDRTGDRLGAALPLLDDDEVIAVVGWPPAVDVAVTERFDLAVVSVRADGVDAAGDVRRRSSDRGVRIVDAWDATIGRVSRLLVPAAAIGPGQVLVPRGTADALDVLAAGSREVWLVGGIGRVLPGRLYDAAARAVGDDSDATEQCALVRFDRVAGPRGVERPADAAARVDCPVVPELLRPF